MACGQAQGDQADAQLASRAGARALAQDHRRRPRLPSWPGISFSATSGRAKRWTAAMSATSPTSRPGRAGPTWPGHRPGLPPGRRLGPGRSHAHRAGRRRPHHGLRQPGTRAGRHLPFGPRAVNTRAVTSPSWPGPTASCSRSGARACWDNAVAESSSPPSSASSSTHDMANEGRTSTRRLRVHRGLVQHPPAALDARLPQPRPIRSSPPQRRPSGGIINTTNLSVEPDQAHWLSVSMLPGTTGWRPVVLLCPASRRTSPVPRTPF